MAPGPKSGVWWSAPVGATIALRGPWGLRRVAGGRPGGPQEGVPRLLWGCVHGPPFAGAVVASQCPIELCPVDFTPETVGQHCAGCGVETDEGVVPPEASVSGTFGTGGALEGASGGAQRPALPPKGAALGGRALARPHLAAPGAAPWGAASGQQAVSTAVGWGHKWPLGTRRGAWGPVLWRSCRWG